jgi:geranylgeranyl pyrophosphate synthase
MKPSSDTTTRPARTIEQPSAKERFAYALSLTPELAQVEEVIRAACRSDVALMKEIPEYLLGLGGKRIRPVLTLLCAKALGAQEITRDIIEVSAGIELIHMATLLHDDIVDQSPIRRHKPSPYAKYGTSATLLSGDFLLTRAFGLCAKLDHEIIMATEQACIELVEGETLETVLSHEQHSLTSSLTIARRKTAALFRLAAFCAAHLTDVSDETKGAMARFGESLGLAFQIIDDILDVISDEATLGKRPGLDIAERKPSIVNVLWLESGDKDAQRLLTPAGGPGEQEFVERALATLRDSAVIHEAKRLAKSYADEASRELSAAFDSNIADLPPEGEALFAVIDFALERMV